MIYLNPESLAEMHRDLGRWYDRAVAASERGRPPARPGGRTAMAGANTP